MIPTRLCATVVTYEPDENLLANISSYLDFVEEVFVIDNSERTNPTSLQTQLQHPKIRVHINFENKGIAFALNMAARLAIDNGYNWLLTMDQDSSFSNQHITQYIQCFEQIQSNQVGMMGIEFNPNKQKDNHTNGCMQREVDCLITSGSIVNLMHWKTLQGFNEQLFIDGVDDEYCLRLIRQRLSVTMLGNIHLNHQLGNDVIVRNWHIGAKVKRNIHSPIRMYYMVRNYLYLISSFKHDFPEKTTEYKKVLLNKIKNNILYHPKRFKTISMLFKGWYHFKMKKFGKL